MSRPYLGIGLNLMQDLDPASSLISFLGLKATNCLICNLSHVSFLGMYSFISLYFLFILVLIIYYLSLFFHFNNFFFIYFPSIHFSWIYNNYTNKIFFKNLYIYIYIYFEDNYEFKSSFSTT